MNFTQVGKRKYESATVRDGDGNRDKGLRFSRSITGAIAAWVAINGNLTSMAEVTTAIDFLKSITEDHFTAPVPNAMAAPPASLLAPPPASDDTVPCHPDWPVGSNPIPGYVVVTPGKAKPI